MLTISWRSRSGTIATIMKRSTSPATFARKDDIIVRDCGSVSELRRPIALAGDRPPAAVRHLQVKMVKTLVCAAALLVPLAASAQTPITSRFSADPSPHVFAGQFYVYATDDASNSGKYWDSTA